MNCTAGKLDWDYSMLAADYDRRPDYHPVLLDEVIAAFELRPGDALLDIGAGTGKLTAVLCKHAPHVIACEPNAAMRARGEQNTRHLPVRWLASSGERLPLKGQSVGAVCYGSSFNVLDTDAALSEAARVVRPGGWWIAAWNHRDLNDPLQRDVEALIHRWVPSYSYGTRRQSPALALTSHGQFEPRGHREARFVVTLPTAEWLAAWRSHATLQRQAGDRFNEVLSDLHRLLHDQDTVQVPYLTRVWWAQRKDAA